MTRNAIWIAGLVGFAVLARTAGFYLTEDALAFAVTAAMGVALGFGLIELLREERRTRALGDELGKLGSPREAAELDAATPVLRNLLRARLEGTALPVPGPAFTPFLVGLLVMLGLLGTFLGLFETLRGARLALTASADVEALRAGLSQPMAGLMRSFGTSAAGVVTSAALGLASVFLQRENARLSARLQAAATGPLAHLSPARRQLVALEALARQGEALPAAAAALREAVADLRSLEGAWTSAHDRAASDGRASFEALARDLRTTLLEVVPAAAAASQEAVAPLVARSVDETVAAARAHLGDVRKAVEADAQLRRDAERAAAQHLDAHLLEVRKTLEADAELRREVERASAEHLDAHLVRVVGELERLTEARGSMDAALLDRIEAHTRAQHGAEAARDARWVELVGRVQGDLVAATDAIRARVAANAEAEAAQHARAEQIFTRLAATSAELGAAARDQMSALATFVSSTAAKLEESDARSEGRVAALVSTMSETLEVQAGRVLALEERLVALGQERADALAELLRAHAAEGQRGLEENRRLVEEAASATQASGAELLAVAEMFAASVDRHKEAAEQWLESLGAIEKAIVEAGEDAAADALGQQLARTHEIFDHQLRFQQELLDQLRGGARASDVAPRHGAEPAAEGLDVTA